ncbi:MAG: cytochrome c [Rhodothermales bacterium]|nr:cytochrome c [Rhodothermales bacterium]
MFSIQTTSVLAQDETPNDVLSHGEEIYVATCIACHGNDGKGAIPGVQDLSAVDGLLAKSDDELIESITNGFSLPSSPIAMPPNGGNPNLDPRDIVAVITYLRDRFQIPMKARDLSD